MKVLMISIDKGLLGKGQLGDVVERHQEYARNVSQLDIIVFCSKGFEPYKISPNSTAYPTNSSRKLRYACDAKKIGKKLFKENQYDLIVTQEPFLTGLVGVCLKKKFGAKLLVHLHGDFKGLFFWLAKLLVLPKADGIRVMSQGQMEKLSQYKEKVRVISTPVDLEKYQRTENREQRTEIRDQRTEIRDQRTEIREQKTENRIVLHVGRDDKVKDYKSLLKAFGLVKQKLANVRLVKVLGGKEFSKAVKEYSGNDLKVDVYPKTDHKSLVNFYHQAEVVVLSSTSESFGKVLVEANACGKPVVSTATTGAKEIIQDGYNGYLVPIGDYQALADKIIYLLNNPQKAKELGENGRKLVKEKFSNNTAQIIKFWNDLIFKN
ncbi:MAG: glycosyltransferase family 4 protein [Patescibacteria group bacterium]